MADFNTQFSAPQGAGANVIAPVQRAGDTSSNPWIGFAGNMASIFAANMQENKKKEKEEQTNQILADFTREQTAISDAVAQGVPKDRAAAQARATFSKYAANYPALVEDFNKANKALFEHTELGVAKSEAQMFVDEKKQLRSDAIKAGVTIPADAPESVVNAQLTAFQETRRIEEDFKRQVARSAEKRAMTSEERAADNFEKKEIAIKTLVALGSSHLPAAQEFVKAAIAKGQRGDMAGAQQDLNIYFQNIEAGIAAAAAANPELASGWKNLFAEIKKVGLEGTEPKADAAKLEDQLKMVQTKAKLTALASPGMQPVYAVSSLLGGNVPAIFWDVNNAARDAIIGASTPGNKNVVQIVGNKDNEAAAYPLLEHNLRLLQSGSAIDPEATKLQVSTGLNSILKQVGKADSLGLGAKELTSVAKLMESPQYAYAVTNGLLDKEAAYQAGRAFQVIYEQSASKALSNKLGETFTVPGAVQNKSVGELVNIQWNGSGVSLSPNTAIEVNVDPANPTGSFYRDRLISDMKKGTQTINQLIMIGAHREGHTNYAKFWEENKHNILPTYYPDPAKLKVGQTVKGKNGKSYKYIGGNYNDIANSYMEVGSAE